jgi:phosphoglycerol transferase
VPGPPGEGVESGELLVGDGGVLAAGATIAAIVAGGIVQHVPAAVHAATHGHNTRAHVRPALQSDYFGLPLMQLVLPVPDHRLSALARLRAVYEGEKRPGAAPSESVALGTVAAAGWVALVVLALVPGVRPGPVRVLAALTVGVSLIAVTGGGGSLFNYLVTATVRAYARFAIVLTFFALAAVGFALDRVAPGRLRLLACGLLVAFGLWDQTPRTWFTSRSADKTRAREERFASDRAFFGAMEASLPPGGMVFQLPFVSYPECHYEHARGVTLTKSLRFSFGAMMNRVEDGWARATASRPTDDMLDRLVLRDFVAVCLVRNFLEPADHVHLANLTDRLGPGTEDARKTHVWFDLRPWRDRLLARIGPDEFARRAAADREAIGVEWLGPVKSHQPLGEELETALANPGHVGQGSDIKFHQG